MFSADDYRFMALAIQLADKPLMSPHPNPRVGCVIVKNGEVTGQGYHQIAGDPHAEVYALREAGESAKNATAYVSLEPCCHHGKTPPCTEALIEAGVTRVIIAMLDPNPKVAGKGAQRLRDAGIAVATGLLQAESEKLNRGFIKRMQKALPWVRVKIAASLDGRTAMASGESQWITGKSARHDVQLLRARSDAILTGIGTVLKDDPQLTVRSLDIPELAKRQPLRVVLDSQNRLPGSAKLLQQAGETWVYAKDSVRQNKYGGNVQVKQDNHTDTGIDLFQMLKDLAKNEINEVHVEAGATLNGALLAANLVDELVIYMAPIVMGNESKGMFNIPGLEKMQDKFSFQLLDSRIVGQDLRISLQPSMSRH